MQTREQILEAIRNLPEDADFEDALERIYVLYKINRGIGQADRGELLDQNEARRRMAQWLK